MRGADDGRTLKSSRVVRRVPPPALSTLDSARGETSAIALTCALHLQVEV